MMQSRRSDVSVPSVSQCLLWVPIYSNLHTVWKKSWYILCAFTMLKFTSLPMVTLYRDLHTIQRVSWEIPGPPMSFLFMKISTQSRRSHGKSQDLPWDSSMKFVPLHSPKDVMGSPANSQCNISRHHSYYLHVHHDANILSPFADRQ